MKDLSKRRRNLRLAISFVLAVVFLYVLAVPLPGTLYRERNFFGSASVKREGEMLTLYHGRIIHGKQYIDPAKASINAYPYFAPAALVLDFLHNHYVGQPLNICIIGLGTGAIACEAKPGDQLLYLEIDPKIYHIAERWFSYLKRSAVPVSVEIGDGRLLLKESKDTFDTILVDAFGGDAIPVHLLTTEAINIYLEHLKPNGLIVFHVTNSYVNLPPVLGNAAVALKLAGRELDFHGVKYVVLSRDEALVASLDQFAHSERAQKYKTTIEVLPTQKQIGVWTDDYSNLFGLLKWHGEGDHTE